VSYSASGSPVGRKYYDVVDAKTPTLRGGLQIASTRMPIQHLVRVDVGHQMQEGMSAPSSST